MNVDRKGTNVCRFEDTFEGGREGGWVSTYRQHNLARVVLNLL